METVLLYFVFFVAGLSIYFIPSIVATVRKHPSSAAIFAVNLIFGLSIIGWVAALIWALTGTGNSGNGSIVINGGEYEIVRKR